MFTRAITCTPCQNMINGISNANLGLPDYQLALKQHKSYVAALAQCGLDVTILAADEAYPDSTFVEDAALLTPHCAIITRPGAPSRQGEIGRVAAALTAFYDNIEQITVPGTVEGGDVMMVGSHFYIGLSQRTNRAGANQLINILQKHGLTGSVVPLQKVLHLKTGVAYLENNNLLAHGEFLDTPNFQQFNIIPIDDAESYAANCIWVNGTVLVPAGFPLTAAAIERAGYPTLSVDVSEFRKLDGGLSCLSLRF